MSEINESNELFLWLEHIELLKAEGSVQVPLRIFY